MKERTTTIRTIKFRQNWILCRNICALVSESLTLFDPIQSHINSKILKKKTKVRNRVSTKQTTKSKSCKH